MKVIIAAAGTGGHINPGIAIANKIKSEQPNSEIIFIGTERGLENDLVPRAGYTLKTIEAYGFSRKVSIENVKEMYKTFASIKEAKKIIEEFKPDVVIGTGGYICVPVMLAAKSKKIPTVLHESNAFPGIAVKMLSKKVNLILVGFEDAIKKLPKAKKIVVTGTPTKLRKMKLTTEETIAKVNILLKNLDKTKPMVVICPATTWRLKHWNKDNWKQVVEAIKDKCSLVFTGTAGDKDLISYIGGDNFINLAGQTNIKDLIEIFSRATLVMAPDSGSAHLARATEIPAVISIFCCTPPTSYGPFGDDKKYFALNGNLKCQPCHTRKCPLQGADAEQCLNNPQPEKIINIVNNILQNSKHSV